MGVNIELLGGKCLTQMHNIVKTANVQPKARIDTRVLRARIACPAVLCAKFWHSASVTVVFRSFHQRQRHIGHVLLLGGQRQHSGHAQGYAGCLHLALKAAFNLSIKCVALLYVQFFRSRGRQGYTNGLTGGILRHGWGRSAKAQQQGVARCRGFKRGHKLGAAVGFVAAQVHGGSNGARAGQHKGYIRVGGQLS